MWQCSNVLVYRTNLKQIWNYSVSLSPIKVQIEYQLEYCLLDETYNINTLENCWQLECMLSWFSDGSGNFPSRFPGRDETGITVSSRLVSTFWDILRSRLVSNSISRELQSLVLSRMPFNVLICLEHISCLVSLVSTCLVSAKLCLDPSDEKCDS